MAPDDTAATDDAAALHRAATAVVRAMGGEVRVFAGADNCVRPRQPGEGDADGGDARALPFVVEVEGTPNLLHELAHVLLLGRMAKDHATDYAHLPYDLTTPRGRRLLFEELACCSASCAWHPGSDADARAWFAEQVAIQDCFFRTDGDLAAFLADADRALASDGEGAAAIAARAATLLRDALAANGLDSARAAPRRRFDLLEEWRVLRRPR
jgi:hypothetical protein